MCLPTLGPVNFPMLHDAINHFNIRDTIINTRYDSVSSSINNNRGHSQSADNYKSIIAIPKSIKSILIKFQQNDRPSSRH